MAMPKSIQTRAVGMITYTTGILHYTRMYALTVAPHKYTTGIPTLHTHVWTHSSSTRDKAVRVV